MSSSTNKSAHGKDGKHLLFYVQHLLGVGHVFRAQRLCEGFTKAGFSVDVIFGGEPLPNMKFAADSVHFLPYIKAGAIDYSFNIDADGNRLSDKYMMRRQEKLLEIFAGLSPDLILIEAWPFGRRVVRHEIMAMLDMAKARDIQPLVYTSVRDILQEGRKPGRIEEAVDNVDKYIDGILVHSDPALIKLDETFALAKKIADKVHYTGFVRAKAESVAKDVDIFDVIVSIGGGAFGAGLIKCALDARPLSSLKEASWCLCTGPNLPEEAVEYLRQNCPKGVSIKTFLPNLAACLARAKLSISQVGYNTTMDVLSAGQSGQCRGVLVPSDIAGQSEQLRRAELLEQKGYAVCLPESQLSPKVLALAIDQAIELPKIKSTIDFSGVENSVRILQRAFSTRGGR